MTDAQWLALVRGVHTAIYIVMAASVFVVLYAGVTGAHGPWLWLALGLVAIETVIFVGGGMKCPMTALAARYGASGGADTFLPAKLTQNTLKFFGPLIVIALLLLAARWWGVLR